MLRRDELVCVLAVGAAASISLESRVLRRRWRHNCKQRLFSASISLESRVLRPAGLSPRGRQRAPPQSLWNHGCCDSVIQPSCKRLKTASISLESRVLRRGDRWLRRGFGGRLNLFGITGAATFTCEGNRQSPRPPQSLWNHGCCDEPAICCEAHGSSRLNLFGITGAATAARRTTTPKVCYRLNLFGITGAATAGTRGRYESMIFCCARERGAKCMAPPAGFGAENARWPIFYGGCERSLGSGAAPQHS